MKNRKVTIHKSHNSTHLSVSVMGSWFLKGHLHSLQEYRVSSTLAALILLMTSVECELSCKIFISGLQPLDLLRFEEFEIEESFKLFTKANRAR